MVFYLAKYIKQIARLRTRCVKHVSVGIKKILVHLLYNQGVVIIALLTAIGRIY